MCWTLVLTTLLDTAAGDGEKQMNRELRAAEKVREKAAEAFEPADGGVLANGLPSPEKPKSSIEELKQIAFMKLRLDTASWMEAVIVDAVMYAKEHSPRDKEMLDRVLRKSNDSPQRLNQNDIATMFATSVWPSLKNRGWKAEVISEGASIGKTRYSYDGKDVSGVVFVLSWYVYSSVSPTHSLSCSFFNCSIIQPMPFSKQRSRYILN